jgi:hypothetical protein
MKMRTSLLLSLTKNLAWLSNMNLTSNAWSETSSINLILRKESEMKYLIVSLAMVLASSALADDEYLGNYSSNKYDPNSTSNTFGTFGSKNSAKSINNSFGEYGSQYSPNGVTNKFTTGGPKLYDSQGSFKGTLNSNKYDPNSVSNPYGKYGSKYSADSINNPYGKYGNKFSTESVNNPYGNGLTIIGD